MTFRKDIPDGPKYREKCLRQKIQSCAVCGYSKHLHSLTVHHIDGDRSNNSLDNLIPLCNSCHRKVHNTCAYSGRIAEFDEKLNSEVIEVPDSVIEMSRKVRDNGGSSITSIEKAIRHMVREGGYDV